MRKSATDHAEGASPLRPRWALPTKFLPVPSDFSNGSTTLKEAVTDLHNYSHSQLMEMAAHHNQQQGMPDDPFEAVLSGIAERAHLRPDSKEASTFTLGLKGLPPHGKYAKAWRKIMRGTKHQGSSTRGSAADSASKRASAQAAADRLAKLSGKADKPRGSTSSLWQQLQPQLTSEQVRWRSSLATFLGRPVDVPLLAPGAPVLDLQKLLIEVMSQGGQMMVTKTDGWQALAAHWQRDADLAPLVAAVYDCYLHPLELDMPYSFRAAKAIDHIISKNQQRAAMGSRVATFDSVVFAADKAEAALQQLQQVQHQQQHQQQQPHQPQHQTDLEAQQPQPEQQQQVLQQASSFSLPATAAAADGPMQPQGPDVSQCCLQLLRLAACQPEAVVQQLRQYGLRGGLHDPSRAACIREHRRLLQIIRSRKGNKDEDKDDGLEQELDFEEDEQEQEEEEDIAAEEAGGGQAADAATTAAAAAAVGTAAKGNKARSGTVSKKRAGSKKSSNKAATAAAGAAGAGLQMSKLELDAARWIVLSRRAASSGPPGCQKPLLQLPGMQQLQQQQQQRRRDSNSASGGKSHGAAAGRKRAFHGTTPKCGACHTCLHPSLKRACIINRERIANGLPPVMPDGST